MNQTKEEFQTVESPKLSMYENIKGLWFLNDK